MPQSPDTMFADKGYEGWDKLSAYQKVERMMEIHKGGHEGEDVSIPTPFTPVFVIWICVLHAFWISSIHLEKEQTIMISHII